MIIFEYIKVLFKTIIESWKSITKWEREMCRFDNMMKTDLKKEYLRKIEEMARKGIKDPLEIFKNKFMPLSKEELIEAQRELENDI